MQNDLLLSCALFEGISALELEAMLSCLEGKEKQVAKGDPVFLEGDPADFVGVVLSGAVQIVRDAYDGSRSVLTVIEPGELFAEAFSCAQQENLPVSAFALADSRVLFLDIRRVLTVCVGACSFHNRLVRNLLKIIASKNLILSQKIQLMSRKTTQEKIMAYLMDQAKKRQSDAFTIPYDRQALADHLGVERSAMSAQISKMKKQGLIDTKGSWFRILIDPNE